jgi:hypothetical protein
MVEFQHNVPTRRNTNNVHIQTVLLAELDNCLATCTAITPEKL